jgi:hypothetical protein
MIDAVFPESQYCTNLFWLVRFIPLARVGKPVLQASVTCLVGAQIRFME